MNATRVFPGRIVAAVLLMLCVASACRSNGAERQRAMDDAPARRLVGVWDVTLHLDRALTLTSHAKTVPRDVAGTITLVEDHFGRATYPQMSAPTHAGAYDVDFRIFDFQARDAADAPIAVARTTHDSSTSLNRTHADSAYIVLNPGTSRYALMLAGAFTGDSIAGVWSVESFLGGGGTFALHRHMTP